MTSTLTETMLWYDQPAADWNEALPVGNGRLGGMVFGTVEQERIQFNEDSVWYGGPRNRNNPDALPNLATVRELIFAGKLQKAHQLTEAAFSGIPRGQRHFVTAGDLFLRFTHPEGDLRNYRRELDLQRALAVTSYEYGGVRYQREVFCSYPDQVMVIRLTADRPGALTFTARFERQKGRYMDHVYRYGTDTVVMENDCGGRDGLTYSATVKALATGGQVRVIGEHLFVEKADEVILLLAVVSSFRYPEPVKQCLTLLEQATKQSYETLKDKHIRDYQALFNRVTLELKADSASQDDRSLPTSKRLEAVQQGADDIGLMALYFQYGRYLLISSSRPGSLPANLQGVWNDSMTPPWGSKYTININTEMNYWPAEVCNLSECHEPLFELLERMRVNGRITAQTMYGCRGFVAHHNTDIWADTAPQDHWAPGTQWVMGAAWLALHLWEHYLFHRDEAFLARAYDTMKEAALFFLDFLVESPEGYLVTCPSVSPENRYRLPNGEVGTLCYGPYMDTHILLELFNACIEASKVLNTDEDLREQWISTKARLPEMKIGKYGQLQEWIQDYEEQDPGHRHISHLFGLHPGTTISPQHTPELAEAAKVTLHRRLAHGGGHTGWSRAWIINFWARLLDGEQAYLHLKELLRQSTLPNLLDTHPPFQIDGNFGGTAGIAEMLVQSHLGYIHFLPALPKKWANGRAAGLRARGGFVLDFAWKQHRLTEARITSKCGLPLRLYSAEKLRIFGPSDSELAVQKAGEIVELPTEKGAVYQVIVD